ncbi:MAG TPA: YkgJ family cysteine cluster protein [Bacteroidales bacterium]|nr:YkgJ family cysteine cluster protein [Bacteroidales bacterium]HPM13016.1 YkgJ family cysteine cluster protein [Bacteroidales bacterium]
MYSKKIVSDFLALPKPICDTDILSKFQSIKRKVPKDLDAHVHNLHIRVFSQIDCLDCANCCKSISPGITDADIQRLSKFLKLKPSKLVELYFTLDTDGLYMFTQSPCPFLMPDNYCSVYEARPRACREYPHTDRRRFEQLTRITKENVSVCPAVYHIMKQLSV